MQGRSSARPVFPAPALAEATIPLAAGRFKVGVTPDAGGSLSFFRTTEGTEILKDARCGGDAAASACFPMVPFCNRVRDRRFIWEGSEHLLGPNTRDGHQAAHGFGWRAAWEIVSSTADSAHLRHRHVAGAWPWDYVADQRITLDAGGLTIELSVVNESTSAMPAGLGLHPYFPLTPGCRVAFTARTIDAVDVLGYPTADPREPSILRDAGAGSLDPRVGSRYVGGVDGDLRVTDAGGAHALIVRDSGCSDLALHVEQGNGLFCLEPMSHAVGALNASDPLRKGVRALSPGERLTLTMRLDVEPVT